MTVAKGKQQKNLTLTNDAITKLQELAELYGVSEAAVIELLIRTEARVRRLF